MLASICHCCRNEFPIIVAIVVGMASLLLLQCFPIAVAMNCPLCWLRLMRLVVLFLLLFSLSWLPLLSPLFLYCCCRVSPCLWPWIYLWWWLLRWPLLPHWCQPEFPIVSDVASRLVGMLGCCFPCNGSCCRDRIFPIVVSGFPICWSLMWPLLPHHFWGVSPLFLPWFSHRVGHCCFPLLLSRGSANDVRRQEQPPPDSTVELLVCHSLVLSADKLVCQSTVIVDVRLARVNLGRGSRDALLIWCFFMLIGWSPRRCRK